LCGNVRWDLPQHVLIVGDTLGGKVLVEQVLDRGRQGGNIGGHVPWERGVTREEVNLKSSAREVSSWRV
jgi:hypothetical protein